VLKSRTCCWSGRKPLVSRSEAASWKTELQAVRNMERGLRIKCKMGICKDCLSYTTRAL
jgi:hypothetical protein